MTRTILKAGIRMPKIPWWVARAIGLKELLSWVPTYLTFTWTAILAFFLAAGYPNFYSVGKNLYLGIGPIYGYSF